MLFLSCYPNPTDRISACHEEDALGASNAFMLFYERVSAEALARRREREAAEPPIEALITSLPASENEDESQSTVYRAPQQLPTPPDSDGEDDSSAETPTPTPQSPPLSPNNELDHVEHDEVPELSRDVSSRDSSPETPPPSAMPPMPKSKKTGKGRRKGRERVGGAVN